MLLLFRPSATALDCILQTVSLGTRERVGTTGAFTGCWFCLINNSSFGLICTKQTSNFSKTVLKTQAGLFTSRAWRPKALRNPRAVGQPALLMLLLGLRVQTPPQHGAVGSPFLKSAQLNAVVSEQFLQPRTAVGSPHPFLVRDIISWTCSCAS